MTEAIYLLLTESFEESRLVDGYGRHTGTSCSTSKFQDMTGTTIVSLWQLMKVHWALLKSIVQNINRYESSIVGKVTET